jgi:hypothetical protein
LRSVLNRQVTSESPVTPPTHTITDTTCRNLRMPYAFIAVAPELSTTNNNVIVEELQLLKQ